MTADFLELPARVQKPFGKDHFHQWFGPDGGLVAEFFRTAEGYLLRFPRRADFAIPSGGGRASCAPAPEVSHSVLMALYFNQVKPLMRSLDGALVLHASATRGPNGALAFLGASGRGKSTLAAALARAGHPFLTDDGIWLERAGPSYLVAPNQPALRLWPDSEIAVLDASADPGERTKKSYRQSGADLPHEDRAQPLCALYLLGEGCAHDVTIEPLNPGAAVVELVKQAFILDLEDRARHRAHFDRLAALAKAVPCFALDFPRRYEELPRVIAAVLAHASDGARPT